MIKLEHVVLPSPVQMEFVIEGMRNPMNSYDKSDTVVDYNKFRIIDYRIGTNDLSLMQKLSAAGTDHRKFMRMMPVMVRITAPLYWWEEFDTYKVGTVANSCSTMHKITAKEFTLDDFSKDKLTPRSIMLMEDIINELNFLREYYIHWDSLDENTKNAREWCTKEHLWYQLIQLLPSSYNQTRNVTLNYEVLANIYKSRKNHKLDEWREFCDWIKSLPHSELITGEECVRITEPNWSVSLRVN